MIVSIGQLLESATEIRNTWCSAVSVAVVFADPTHVLTSMSHAPTGLVLESVKRIRCTCLLSAVKVVADAESAAVVLSIPDLQMPGLHTQGAVLSISSVGLQMSNFSSSGSILLVVCQSYNIIPIVLTVVCN